MNKGFTLIEVILAIFILTMGILGMFTLVNKGLSSIGGTKSKFTASYLAQEGIEIARSIRDSNWIYKETNPGANWYDNLSDGDCSPSNTSGCPAIRYVDFYTTSDPENNVEFAPAANLVIWDYGVETGKFYVSYAENSCASFPAQCYDTPFNREIQIKYFADNANLMEVKSVVEWQEKGQSREVEVLENLYNWK